ncbi:MAG: ZmpA/ZmpB/ZmpC family metallo-endopeptidase-related protein [Polyangiaceae bacterium]
MRYQALICLAVLGSWGCGAGDMEDVGVSSLAVSVGNGADFKAKLTADPYGSYTLTTDIDMGNTALQIAAFYGQLDGANHTIKNVTQLLPSSSGNAGLFGLLQGATVKNLKLSNVKFRADSAGGLASQCNAATVQNVSVQGSIEGGSLAGGLCGGGGGGSITSSSATGSVKSTSGSAGGLVGRSDIGRSGLGSVLSSCSVASMTVTGVQASGGLIGYCQDLTIDRAAVDATVSAQTTAGGLCGEMNGGMISNSYAKGSSVTASGGPAGGLVGTAGIGQLGEPLDRLQIEHAYALYTNVNASKQAGGIVGVGADTAMQNVYAVGNVTGTAAVGGLIGRAITFARGWSLNNGIYRGVVNDRSRDWAGVMGVYDGFSGDIQPRWEGTLFDSSLDTSSHYAIYLTSQKPATTNQLKLPSSTPSGVYCFNAPPSTRCGDNAFPALDWDAGSANQHHILKNMPGVQPR